jgi:hypothetical protein
MGKQAARRIGRPIAAAPSVASAAIAAIDKSKVGPQCHASNLRFFWE